MKWAYLVALGVWLGTVVFLSFVAAPGVFAAFPESQRAEAGRILGKIFPGYYGLGYGCGTVLVVTSTVLWLAARQGSAVWGTSALVAAGMLAAVLWAGVVIQPRVHELRPRIHLPEVTAEVKGEFDRLHRRAVQLNIVVLVGALALTGLTAAKLRP